MAHRIELNNIGSIGIGGVLVIVAGLTAGYFFGPKTLSRGFTDNVVLSVLGSTYSSYVQCDSSVKLKPSLSKAFLGIHDGERVLVRGYGREEARKVLTESFPECSLTNLNRESKPLWRRYAGI